MGDPSDFHATKDDKGRDKYLIHVQVPDVASRDDVDIAYPENRSESLRVWHRDVLCFDERLPGEVDADKSTYNIKAGKKGWIILILKKTTPALWLDGEFNGDEDSSSSNSD